MSQALADPKPLAAWSGTFGDDYTRRCEATSEVVAGRIRAWAPILDRMAGAPPESALEVGPNLGLNLRGLKALSEMRLWGIEPNPSACRRLVDDGVLPDQQMMQGFGHDIPLADGSVDLAFTCGVLIHVDPTLLEKTVREIHRTASRWVFCAEYFSPRPETITYRGEEGLLFKRDFGGLYLDLFDDLELVDYGFWWRRTTVMDDCTWWLFRKR